MRAPNSLPVGPTRTIDRAHAGAVELHREHAREPFEARLRRRVAGLVRARAHRVLARHEDEVAAPRASMPGSRGAQSSIGAEQVHVELGAQVARASRRAADSGSTSPALFTSSVDRPERAPRRRRRRRRSSRARATSSAMREARGRPPPRPASRPRRAGRRGARRARREPSRAELDARSRRRCPTTRRSRSPCARRARSRRRYRIGSAAKPRTLTEWTRTMPAGLDLVAAEAAPAPPRARRGPRAARAPRPRQKWAPWPNERLCVVSRVEVEAVRVGNARSSRFAEPTQEHAPSRPRGASRRAARRRASTTRASACVELS